MSLTLADALRIAANDSEFAAVFMKNPSVFKTPFNLTPAQIEGVEKAGEAFGDNELDELDDYE